MNVIAEGFAHFWIIMIVLCIIFGALYPGKDCKCGRGACSRYDEEQEELKFKVGQKWKTRCGVYFTIVYIHKDPGSYYPIKAKPTNWRSAPTLMFTLDGRFSGFGKDRDHKYDLLTQGEK